MLFSTYKFNAFLYRLLNRISGRKQLYEFKVTVHYGDGCFSGVWDSSGHPVLNPRLEWALYNVFPDELKEAMFHAAQNLEDEARILRRTYESGGKRA